MARKTRPIKRRSTQSHFGGEDAFTAWILEVVAWVKERSQLVTVVAVILVVLTAGTIYYVNQRAAHLELAASELEAAQIAALVQEPLLAQDEIRAYISRFRDTPYAIEAYLVLGELQLNSAQPQQAVQSLTEIAPSFESPLHVQATALLAVAYEASERWNEAIEVYQELLEASPYSFQKREAGVALARAHLAQGNLEGAARAYEDLLATLEPNHPERPAFEMRLAEVQAQL